MVPFSAYFDASGTVDRPVLTVAGFVSTVKKWVRFEQEWKTILKSEHITTFHMTDFVSSGGEFKDGWRDNTDRRREFISRLAACLRKNVNKSFRATMVVSDFRKVNEAFVLSERWGVPYALCSLLAVYKLRLWAKRKGAESRLLYVFEDGDKGKGDFDHDHKRIYGTPVNFLTKEQACPLQAADFAGWKMRTAVQEALKADHTVETGLRLLRSLDDLRKIPKDGGVINQEVLLKWCTRHEVPRRTTGVAS